MKLYRHIRNRGLGDRSGLYRAAVAASLLFFLPYFALSSFAADDLISVFKRAQETDPALRAAMSRLEASKAERPLARSELLPHLTALAGIGRYKKVISGVRPDDINEDYWGDDYSATLVQPIFNGQAYVSLKMADTMVQAREAEVLAASQDLMARVTRAYFQFLDAKAQERVAQDRVLLCEKIYDQAQAFLRAGTGDIIAVREAGARLDAAKSDVVSACNRVSIARENLAILTHGQIGDIVDVRPFNPVGPDPDDISKWVDAALENQPRLKEAGRQLRLANQRIDYFKRERWPRLELEGKASYSKGGFLPDVIYRDAHGAFVLSIPFYLGGSIGAKTSRAASEALVAKHNMQRIKDRITFDTKQAFLQLKDSIAQLHAARQAMESARVSMDATNRGYEIGTRNVIDALDMTDKYITSRRLYMTALYSHIVARVDLKMAAGILTVKDLESINGLLVSRRKEGGDR